ncbi:MAG: flagellar motor protein MotB [Desulfobacterales bacterium GWB2_56_26]|nr:MAG: flagellar motor protein MotB [Desulfobacterales bacterium GWB2_56_26]
MASDSRYSQQSSSIWPGYVDVLSSLLMVVIFVLLIFTFSQFILSRILTSQSSELVDLHKQLAEISELLGLERQSAAAMTEKIASLSSQVETLIIDRDNLQNDVDELNRNTLADRETIEVNLQTIASLQQDIQALQTLRRELESRIQEAATALNQEQQMTESLRDRSKALEARLAEETEKTLLSQKDLEQRDIRIQALSALVGEQQEALDNQRNLTADARAEVALLNQKINLLQSQLAEIGKALGSSENLRQDQEVKIQDLGKRLNIELARKVNILEQYRSEFFGRLRAAIAENPLVRIEGDRFVLQAELLFPSGSAELSDRGKEELGDLAEVLGGLISVIPKDLNWILRVDGHTDRVPINTPVFASNWELSTARAVSVVRYLTDLGIPAERLAATGFGEFHPIDPGGTAEAFRKNRRIEMKLTSR